MFFVFLLRRRCANKPYYLRLINSASGPEIVDFWESNRPPPSANPLQKADLHLRLIHNASGPGIVDFWSPNGPLLAQTHWKRWGGEDPRLLQWALK